MAAEYDYNLRTCGSLGRMDSIRQLVESKIPRSEWPYPEAAATQWERDFAVDIVGKAWVRRLSQKQYELVDKVAQRLDERTKDGGVELLEVEEGRRVVKGKIVSIKDQVGFDGAMVPKILVQCRGYRLWGTLPKALDYLTKGDQIEFTATVQRKELGFGFFSRPHVKS